MIGLTGGIASGKSTVANYLASLGAVVLDADQIARAVVEPGTCGWQQVQNEFPAVILQDGSIDRAKLGNIIFSDSGQRQKLEAIIHPLVYDTIQKKALKYRKEGKVLVADVPLLYEVGWDSWLRPIWVVYVDYQVQLERLMKRSSLSIERAEQMIASQMPLTEKIKKADAVIDNNGGLAETYAQVTALWKEFGVENSIDCS